MNNVLQINDWEIKKFLRVVLAIQLAMWGIIGFDVIGFQIPILRELIAFIYLTFIPGILILRVLRLHRLGSIETLLYAVGLSIATVMFTGLLANVLCPLLGISAPISITPLIITISVVVLTLCVLTYVRDKDFSNSSFVDIKEVLSPPALFLCLIPILVLLGTYLVNFHQNNLLLIVIIFLVSVVVVLIAFNKFIPKRFYPLAILAIAISLLWHKSLISTHLWGWDIQNEYYLANLVIEGSYWNSTIPHHANAMLSIVMYAPVFSIVASMDLTWVFKITYPLLFSLVPLGLYRVFQKQTNDRIAFFSCFFFVSLFTFYGEMLQLARQQIAELFLVLLVLLMVSKNMHKIKRSFLFIVFGLSLAVAHYGLSYIYMFSLICAWLILVLMGNPTVKELRDNLSNKLHRYEENRNSRNLISLSIKDRTIGSTFVLLFVAFALTWYMYVSSSSAFGAIVSIGEHVTGSIFTEFLNPEATEGLHIVAGEPLSPLHSVTKYLHLTAQLFIVIGVLKLLLGREKRKFEDEYAAFSLVNLVIILAAIGLPYFASSLNTTRLYQIALIFLAPFCVIGGITVFRAVSRAFRVTWTRRFMRNSMKVLSVFLAAFFLFNSGVIYEIANDSPTSISLNNTIDYPRFSEQEVLGAKWLYSVKGSNLMYADGFRRLLLGSFDWEQSRDLPADLSISGDSYLYLGTYNLRTNEILLINRTEAVKAKDYVSNTISIGKSKIYDNCGAQVYY